MLKMLFFVFSSLNVDCFTRIKQQESFFENMNDFIAVWQNKLKYYAIINHIHNSITIDIYN